MNKLPMDKLPLIELLLPENFELEDGIDAIALVDEPAIEMDFLFFNKTEQKDRYETPDIKVVLSKIVKILGTPQQTFFDKVVKRTKSDFKLDGWVERIGYKFMKHIFDMESIDLMDEILKPYYGKNENIFNFYKGTPWLTVRYMESPTGEIEILDQHRFKFSYIRFVSEDKRIIVTPVMIPNKQMYRADESGEWTAFFSRQTILELCEKYMADFKLNTTNLEHDDSRPTQSTMIESWLVCDDPTKDKSSFYGFSVPPGTWMQIRRINDDATWAAIKAGKYRGVSVQGMFQKRLINE